MNTPMHVSVSQVIISRRHQTGGMFHRFAKLIIALTGVGAAGFTLAAPTATWSPTPLLSTSSQATNVRTAVNAAGTSVVVWDQLVPGSVDAQHPYGINRVYAAVCTPAQSQSAGPSCTLDPVTRTPAGTPVTDGSSNAANAGAVVTPSGQVTVFWSSNAASYAASPNNGGTWSSDTIPADPGYTLVSGVNAQVGPTVGVDGSGDILVVLTKPRATSPVSYDAESLTKPANSGVWVGPTAVTDPTTAGVGIFGSAKLFLNSAGQALLNFGFTTYRGDSFGHWGAAQTIAIGTGGTVYSASAALDAAGTGYFVYRTRYGGAFLSTSTPATVWTTPRHITKFDILGSSLLVMGASGGHALVYGNDMNTGVVRASTTIDGGTTWGTLLTLGTGDYPQAAGSESGLYTIGWSAGGTNWDQYIVASGTGVGTAAAAWIKARLSANFPLGSVAITGNEAVAGWVANGTDVSASIGTVGP